MNLNDIPLNSDDNQEGIAQELEQQRLQRDQLIPKDATDSQICQWLKQFGEPNVLVHETIEQRRDRLAKLIAGNKRLLFQLKEINPLHSHEDEQESASESDSDEEDFYTPASGELIKARQFIIQYSIDKSCARLDRERKWLSQLVIPQEIKRRRQYNEQLKKTQLVSSQIGAIRPISKVKFAPGDISRVISASWDGNINLFDAKTLAPIGGIKLAHNGKIGGLDWNQNGTMFVSGAEDTMVKIHAFNYETDNMKTVSQIKAHEQRVVSTKFHPSDKFIASASFDTTWKLWDVETQKELLLQEGHAKEVYRLSFHPDGSLVTSGGLDNLGMIWDIRSGKLIVTLSSHTKPIYSLDWSMNGYHLATAGGDGLINIWDIRQLDKPSEKLAGHNSIISNVKFNPIHGESLYSCGYDNVINVYSSDNWNKLVTLQGHTGKIMDLDVKNNEIVSSGWDRTIKLWETKF